jgi:hypothetical protein
MPNQPRNRPAISVAIVGICGSEHLLRCLDALAHQRDAPPFEIVVVYDPALSGMEKVRLDHPDIVLSANTGQNTPLELASRALQLSSGDVVLLTEDHCVPDTAWVAKLTAAISDENAATGGAVLAGSSSTATDWAFYFVDFFRYAPPVTDGPSPTLTVCNVAYRRCDLESIDPSWKEFFHETAVNSELRTKFGPLRLDGSARVTMRRHVRLADALRERYVFGRLFGCTRIRGMNGLQRLLYTLGAPLLPGLLMGRMAGKALKQRALRKKFLSSLFPLTGLVLAWSLGELVGYLTNNRPANLTVAPEKD